MPNTHKVLGQLAPSAGSLQLLYTVPSGAAAIISTGSVCNRGVREVDASTFRISVAVNGAADDPKQYLYYDVPLDGQDTFGWTLGLTLAVGDVVRVYAQTATLTFQLFGVEVT